MNAPNVINMPTQDQTQYLDEARAFAAISALDKLAVKLTKQKAEAAAIWKSRTTDARKDLHEPIRDDENANVSTKRAAQLFREAQEHLAICDQVVADRKADLDARSEKIAAVLEADTEVKSLHKTDPRQGDLLATVSAGAMQGLGWCSPGSQAVVYSALLDMVADGVALSDLQQGLLNDMSSSGLKQIDLGIDAAAAIEADENAEAPDDTEAPASPESADIPF